MKIFHLEVLKTSFASSWDLGQLPCHFRQALSGRTIVKGLAKSTILALGLLAGAAVAHAQSSNVAALPPGTAATPSTAPVGPSAAYPGPNPGSGYYGGTVTQQQPVQPSPQYVGPAPGAGYYGTAPAYQKPADWDQNTAMHPYTSNQGPR